MDVSSGGLHALAAGLDSFAGSVSASGEMHEGQVAAAGQGMKEIGSAWCGPRASATLDVGQRYAVEQVPATAGLVTAAGLLRSFAATATQLAHRVAAVERSIAATHPLTSGDDAVADVAQARQRLANLGWEWEEECRAFAARLVAACEPLEASIRAQIEVGSLRHFEFMPAPGPGGVAGWATANADTAFPGLRSLAALLRLGLTVQQFRQWLDTVARIGELVASMAGGDVAEELSTLPPEEVVAYWQSLTIEQQNQLINDRPDLAALVVLANGGTLTTAQLDRLARSNSHGVFSTEFTAELQLSGGLRVVTVNLDADVSVVMTKMSDGSVEMMIFGGVALGGGVDSPTSPGNADVHVAGGGGLGQRLHFESEDEALAAIGELREAVDEGVDIFDYGPEGSQSPGTVASTGSLSVIGDLLNPIDEITEAVDNVFGEEGIKDKILELYGEHGVLTRTEANVYVVGEGEFDILGVAGDAEIDVEFTAYDTFPADGSDESATTGYILSGSVVGRADGAADLGVEVEGSFAVDVHSENGQQFATITVQASNEGGPTSELLDAAGVEIDSAALVGGRTTVQVTAPVTSDVLPALDDVVSSLVDGDIDGAWGTLMDASEVSITVESTASIHTESSIDGVFITAELEIDTTEATTEVSLHQHPGGEMYSQIEVDQMIADAAAGNGLP